MKKFVEFLNLLTLLQNRINEMVDEILISTFSFALKITIFNKFQFLQK